MILQMLSKQIKAIWPSFITHDFLEVWEVHYIWYQSKVKTLGPDGLIDMQVCVSYVIWI